MPEYGIQFRLPRELFIHEVLQTTANTEKKNTLGEIFVNLRGRFQVLIGLGHICLQQSEPRLS